MKKTIELNKLKYGDRFILIEDSKERSGKFIRKRLEWAWVKFDVTKCNLLSRI